MIDSFSKTDIKFLFTGFSISSLFYNFLLETIPKIGVDKKVLEAYIHQKIEPVPNGERVSFIKTFRIWNGIEKVSNRSDIGLLIADQFTLEKAGIIGKLFIGTNNLRESVDIIKRFLTLMISNISIRYEELDDEVLFYFDIVPRFIMPFSIIECYAKICHNWVKEYSGLSSLPIVEINFFPPKPKHFEYYTSKFPDAKVSFSELENFIVLKKDIFYKKNMSNPIVSYDYILKHAKKIKSNLLNSSQCTRKIVNQILIDMPKGECAIYSIAEKFHISASTVKRRLRSEQTSFKKLLEYTRKELSISMLKDKNLTCEEVSYLLGYSEYSPFFRAFKKWYHCSPSKYRENL